VFVAGSSWQPDEEIFIKYLISKLGGENRTWKLVIAPHVIGEEHLKQIMSLLYGKKIVRYTEVAAADKVSLQPTAEPQQLKDADVLIIDCFGLLSSIYHYGTVTYVGGGFGVGIHNVLEAAVWEKPVVIGPNNQKFQEAQELKSVGGCFEIANYEDFDILMERFENEPNFLSGAGQKAGNYVKGKSGATEKVLSDVTI
jgi:3-deoxy-D-manno-octulosonic-acid transferase